MLTYMRLSGINKGLLINFNKVLLKDGIKSFVFEIGRILSCVHEGCEYLPVSSVSLRALRV